MTMKIWNLTILSDVSLLKQETAALEELSRQMFLEVVDLHNQQVPVTLTNIWSFSEPKSGILQSNNEFCYASN